MEMGEMKRKLTSKKILVCKLDRYRTVAIYRISVLVYGS